MRVAVVVVLGVVGMCGFGYWGLHVSEVSWPGAFVLYIPTILCALPVVRLLVGSGDAEETLNGWQRIAEAAWQSRYTSVAGLLIVVGSAFGIAFLTLPYL